MVPILEDIVKEKTTFDFHIVPVFLYYSHAPICWKKGVNISVETLFVSTLYQQDAGSSFFL